MWVKQVYRSLKNLTDAEMAKAEGLPSKRPSDDGYADDDFQKMHDEAFPELAESRERARAERIQSLTNLLIVELEEVEPQKLSRIAHRLIDSGY